MKTKQTTPDGKKENKKPPPEIIYKSEDLVKLGIIEERNEPLTPLVVPEFVPCNKREERIDYKTQSEAFQNVCNIIANKGISLTNAIKFNNQNAIIKTNKNIFYFLIEKHVSYQNYYTYACERRADLLVESSLKTSIKSDDDWYINDKGTKVPNPVKVQRDRLKLDAIKWIAGKMHPRKYGDKIEIDAKIVTQNIMSLDDAKAIIKSLEG